VEAEACYIAEWEVAGRLHTAVLKAVAQMLVVLAPDNLAVVVDIVLVVQTVLVVAYQRAEARPVVPPSRTSS